MSAFIDDSKYEIKVAFKKKHMGLHIVDPKNLNEEELKEYEVHSFWFKKPNWAVTRDIAVASTVMGSNGLPMLSPVLVADNRFRKTLSDWTLTQVDKESGKDQKITLSNSNIDNLAPDLANFLIDKITDLFDTTIE